MQLKWLNNKNNNNPPWGEVAWLLTGRAIRRRSKTSGEKYWMKLEFTQKKKSPRKVPGEESLLWKTLSPLIKIDGQREFAVSQETQTGALYQSRGVHWGGRWEEVSKGRGYVYTYGWFMLRFDRKQQNSVKQLSFNKIFFKKERDTDVKNRLLDHVGESEGGMIWENSIETCITVCK